MTPTTPLLTVDLLIEMSDRPGSPILLIERKYPPLGWALPGGFVDVGETLEHAAKREAMEETCLPVCLTKLLGCYSHPSRDSRNHTVSAVYVATASGEPRAEDDAANFALFLPNEIPAEMAFDHGMIVSDYLRYRNSGELTPLRD